MNKKFEINRTKIKGGCQSGRKVVPYDSKSDLPLQHFILRYSLYAIFLCFFLDKTEKNAITSHKRSLS